MKAIGIDVAGPALADGLTRLDDDIEAAKQDLEKAEQQVSAVKQRLAELRAMRDSVEPFFEKYMVTAGPGTTTDVEQSAANTANGNTTVAEKILSLFQRNAGTTLTIDDVTAQLNEVGVDAERSTVRNSLYYAARKEQLKNVGRGQFIFVADPDQPLMSGHVTTTTIDTSGSRASE